MFSHEAPDYFTLKNAPKIGGRHLEALQALREIGIASVTERQQKAWGFSDKTEDLVRVSPWGIPNKEQNEWAFFNVTLKNRADVQPTRSISFERAVKELGFFEHKVFVRTRKDFDKSPHHQWDHLEIRGIGNIFHLIINFDEEGNINNVNGILNVLPSRVSENSFHADLIQDDTEPVSKHGNMNEVLNIVNKALHMGNKPIKLNNLNPGLIITECLKPRVSIDNNLIKAGITS